MRPLHAHRPCPLESHTRVRAAGHVVQGSNAWKIQSLRVGWYCVLPWIRSRQRRNRKVWINVTQVQAIHGSRKHYYYFFFFHSILAGNVGSSAIQSVIIPVGPEWTLVSWCCLRLLARTAFFSPLTIPVSLRVFLRFISMLGKHRHDHRDAFLKKKKNTHHRFLWHDKSKKTIR